MKTILVTGGAGFIGSHTIDLLLTSGYRVITVDNLATGKITNLDLFNSQLEYIPGDILNYASLLTLIKRSDAVLHLAALPSVPKSIEDPLASFQVNTQGFLHVLQGVRESGRALRVVYASSAAVYGDTAVLPCDESSVLNPLSPYALEKATDEQYALLYGKLFGISCLGLRYFNVYGPRQDPSSAYSGVISKFVDCFRKGEALTIFGDGLQERDFVYVADVARANLLALQSDVCGVMNIATGSGESLLALVNSIESAGGQSLEKIFLPERKGDIKSSVAAVEKAASELGFRASVKLQEGIKNLL